ncbi:MAG: hypothetical protein ABJD68_15500, partial [Nakamurella sp.]
AIHATSSGSLIDSRTPAYYPTSSSRRPGPDYAGKRPGTNLTRQPAPVGAREIVGLTAEISATQVAGRASGRHCGRAQPTLRDLRPARQ